MPKKKRARIVFDFYDVVDGKKKTLKQTIDELSVKQAPQKTKEISGENVRLDYITYENSTGNYKASFVKLRPLEKIGIYSYSGGKREIQLNDDEYVGEEVSFYYLPSIQILVLQRNKYSISASGVEEYFQHFADDDTLELKPIYTEDTYKKLLMYKVISKVETEIAIPESAILDGEVEGWAFPDVQKLRDRLGALKIGVIFTVEDSRKTNLDYKTALKLIRELRQSNKTKKLKANVRKAVGQRLEEIDMFNDLVKVTFYRTLERGKTLSTIALQEMAVEAYKDKEAELKQLFISRWEKNDLRKQ